MITKITLTPYDKILSGKYSHESEGVIVLADSNTIGFTITLPDCTSGNQFNLVVKNIGPNTVRLQPITGQYIDASLYNDLTAWGFISLWSDLNKRWLIIG